MHVQTEQVSSDVASLQAYIADLQHQLISERQYRSVLQNQYQEMFHTWHMHYANLFYILNERNQQLSVATHVLQHEISRHISDRKETELALAESEERYRALVETSPSAIILTDMERTIRFCNQHAATLFGYTSTDELCGKKSTDLLSPLHLHADPLACMQHVFDTGNLHNMEYVMRRKDGSIFPAEVSSVVVADQNSRPKAMTVIVRDITERKLAEHALMTSYDDQTLLNEHLTRSRNLLRALLDGIEDGLMLIDNNGTIQTVNKSMALLLDNTPEDLVGQSWTDIIK